MCKLNLKLPLAFLLSAAMCLTASCATSTEAKPIEEVIDEALDVSAAHYLHMAEALADSVGQLPRYYDGKNVVTSDSRWWCSGFFPGSLWYLYEHTGDSVLLNYAKEYSARVECEKYTTDNHDVGFMIFCPFGNALRLTGDTSYRDIIRQASESLSMRYNPAVGLIRSWDFNADNWQYPVIIDNLMNLEILMWTSRAFKESKFSEIAISHADKTMHNHYRDDYSCYHVVSYDTISGLPQCKQTHQGFSNESTWSRGQAWGLYGYTMMYRETGKKEYLEQAKNIAHFLINHPRMPKDYIPYWDMDDSKIPHALRDASAAAVMASGLIELSDYVEPERAAKYMSVVDRQIRTLASPEYMAPEGENGDFILYHSVGNLPQGSEIDTPLTYADYYFIEALMRYRKRLEKQKDSAEKLVFRTGFEGDNKVVAYSGNTGNTKTGFDQDRIVGKDPNFADKSDFDKDMFDSEDGGLFLLEYTGGDNTRRRTAIIPEPGNPSNHVLSFWLGDSWLASENQVKARIQADIYGIRKPYKEFYQKVRVFLHDDFNELRKYPRKIDWLTLAEFWNNEWWVKGEPHGFRFSVGIRKYTTGEDDLYLAVDAEDAGAINVWHHDNPEAKVPVGQWFTLEYYFKEGNKVTGRFTVAITPDGGERKVIYDVRDFTHNTYDLNPNGMSGYNPMKLYTSAELIGFMKNKGKALQIYWDDFELWKNKKMDN